MGGNGGELTWEKGELTQEGKEVRNGMQQRRGEEKKQNRYSAEQCTELVLLIQKGEDTRGNTLRGDLRPLGLGESSEKRDFNVLIIVVPAISRKQGKGVNGAGNRANSEGDLQPVKGGIQKKDKKPEGAWAATRNLPPKEPLKRRSRESTRKIKPPKYWESIWK